MAGDMSWLDYVIVTIVAIVVLGIFYKALKEPIDMVVGWIKSLLGSARDKIAEGSNESGGTVITYG